jgi:hypothetical protein
MKRPKMVVCVNWSKCGKKRTQSTFWEAFGRLNKKKTPQSSIFYMNSTSISHQGLKTSSETSCCKIDASKGSSPLSMKKEVGSLLMVPTHGTYIF